MSVRHDTKDAGQNVQVAVATVAHRVDRAHSGRETKAAQYDQRYLDEAWERRMKLLNPHWNPYRETLADIG